MRIVIVSIYYKPEPVPKPHELAEGLAARGHQVTVLTGFPNYPSGRLYPGFVARPWQSSVINGVRVIAFRSIRITLPARCSGRLTT